MYSTIELRWFYPHELPATVLNWFEGLGAPLKSADSRTDTYLQPVTVDVGVKLRQGNLELKYRQQDLGSWQIGEAPIGKVELWSKWICADDVPDRLTPAQIDRRQGWVRVEKVRYQRFYQVEVDGHNFHLTPIASAQAGAAAIEVTKLKVRDRTEPNLSTRESWTLGCEYLGDNLAIEPQFIGLVTSLLKNCPLPRSAVSVSCGYPEWLLQH
jgi:hypothetical protein